MSADMADLAEIAAWYYEVCELYVDEDLDPGDHLRVIECAFMSSDCDDFAWLMHEVTGYPLVKVTWQESGWGFGHHSVVRDPEGKFIDVRGVTDINGIRASFRIKPSIALSAIEAEAQEPHTFGIDPDDEGMKNLIGTLRLLPHPPFNTADFQRKLDEYVLKLGNHLVP